MLGLWRLRSVSLSTLGRSLGGVILTGVGLGIVLAMERRDEVRAIVFDLSGTVVDIRARTLDLEVALDRLVRAER